MLTINIELTQKPDPAKREQVISRLRDMTPIMQLIGNKLVEATHNQIEEGGNPPWIPQSTATIKRWAKTDPHPLLLLTGALYGGVSVSNVTSHSVTASDPIDYAKPLQEGWEGPLSNGPARPFLIITDQEKHEYIDMIYRYIYRGDL